MTICKVHGLGQHPRSDIVGASPLYRPFFGLLMPAPIDPMVSRRCFQAKFPSLDSSHSLTCIPNWRGHCPKLTRGVRACKVEAWSAVGEHRKRHDIWIFSAIPEYRLDQMFLVAVVSLWAMYPCYSNRTACFQLVLEKYRGMACHVLWLRQVSVSCCELTSCASLVG